MAQRRLKINPHSCCSLGGRGDSRSATGYTRKTPRRSKGKVYSIVNPCKRGSQVSEDAKKKKKATQLPEHGKDAF
jgi:hypothetical protein